MAASVRGELAAEVAFVQGGRGTKTQTDPQTARRPGKSLITAPAALAECAPRDTPRLRPVASGDIRVGATVAPT